MTIVILARKTQNGCRLTHRSQVLKHNSRKEQDALVRDDISHVRDAKDIEQNIS